MSYFCEVCNFNGKDNNDLNRHFASAKHIKTTLGEGLTLQPVNIHILEPLEQEAYIKNHPYYKDQMLHAENKRKMLNERRDQIYNELGLVWTSNYDNSFAEWAPIKGIETLSQDEIEELADEKYPLDFDEDGEITNDDDYTEKRQKYMECLIGAKSLTEEHKIKLYEELERIENEQKENANNYLVMKHTIFYYTQARNRIIAEYKSFGKAQSALAEKLRKEKEKEDARKEKELQREIVRKAKAEEKEKLKMKKEEANIKILEAKLSLFKE